MATIQRASAKHATTSPQTVDGVRVAGRYTLERLLGQGGTGTVYGAVDGADGRRIALKRLLSGASPRALSLFEREYQVLVSLRHPAIVEAYDYGRDFQGAYYTMELIEGSDLGKQAPLPWRVVCIYLRDIASILGLLHARKLLHRDLAPRNLLRTTAGGLKLIDFGSLAPFGTSSEVVGTPPFVPPEALARGELDERYDLFSLGALGYWLLTGVHAFPAHTLAELPRLWRREPATMSSLVALREDRRLEPVPAALDELVAALLRVDPGERPASTTELIDRLHTIAELTPESQADAVEGYLNSKAFVGRERECELVSRALGGTHAGRGQALLVESEPGLGRTRFLAEVATMARLAGMLALVVRPTGRDRPYEAAIEASKLALASASEPTRAALAVHAPILGRLSGELHTLLGGGALALSAELAGEESMRLQRAFEDLFLTVSAERPLLLAIDDFQARDDASQVVFLSVAYAATSRPIVLVAAAARAIEQEPSAALVSLRRVGVRVQLLPLTSRETQELLRSVFASPPYLERLAQRLYRASEGHPAFCLELARHLVQSGAIRYQEGVWVLPAELSADDLPKSRGKGQRAQLERLSPQARALARMLSVPHHGEYPHSACVAVAGQLRVQLDAVLAELVRERVLEPYSAGVRFAHPGLQRALQEELSTSERCLAHRVIASTLAAEAADDAYECLRAAVHWLRAGEPRPAFPLVLKAAESFADVLVDVPRLRVAAAPFAVIEELFRAHGVGDYALSEPLSMLALAGYFVDKRYATRYGDEAVRVLSELLRLPLARRLSLALGRKLGLIVALAVAAVDLYLRRKRVPTLRAAILRLMQICSALAATAACCIDPGRVAQLAQSVEPFTVLGPDHAASITYRFIKAIGSVVQDRLGQANAELRSLVALLESDAPIRELPASARREYLAGCLFSLGVNVSWREGDEVLRIADRLDGFGPLYQLGADHLRGSYYARQGDTERAEFYRQRLELHAVELGSTWQVETWAVANNTPRAVRTCDPMLMKRVVQELSRLRRDVPSLAREERHARGTYLLMRGKYAEALPFVRDDDEAALEYVGWSGNRSSIARAYNGLADHARARELCRATISQLAPADLDYVMMTINIQLELAHAEAGLGDFAAAHAQLDALCARFEPFENPVTLVMLSEARVRVCLRQRDFERARRELSLLSARCRALAIPTLLQLAAALSRDLERSEHPQRPSPGAALRLCDDASHLLTRARVVLSTAGDTAISERALRGLQVALELSSADDGFVLLPDDSGGAEVYLGSDPPPAELVSWAKQEMELSLIDEQTVMTDAVGSQQDSNYKILGRIHYCVAVLAIMRDHEELLAGALVLGFDGRVPTMPAPEILLLIAERLVS